MKEEHLMGYDMRNKQLCKELFEKIISNAETYEYINSMNIGEYEVRHTLKWDEHEYYLDISFTGSIRISSSVPNNFYIPIIDCYQILKKYYIKGTLIDSE